MANKSTRVRFPIFSNYEVRVIQARDISATCRRLGADSSPCVACFIPDPEGKAKAWLVLGACPDEATIAHEASHAVQELFRWVGAEQEDETFAYHLDYLVGKIHKFLKRAK